MAPPKDAQHRDAADKGWDIFESRQERLDVIWDLLRRDHQHRNRERERRVDESFQSRHLHAAQTEPMKPRQCIQITWQRRRNFLVSFGHVPQFYGSIAPNLERIFPQLFTDLCPLSFRFQQPPPSEITDSR
jgi:hypothetical protein